MKKRALLLVLLLALPVMAQIEEETIPRYTEFPLDNIHILRLQEAAGSISQNVSAMHDSLIAFEERQIRDVTDIRSRFELFERNAGVRLTELSENVADLNQKVSKITGPTMQVPADFSFPPYVIVLLSVNVFLLILVIILIFWLKEQYTSHKYELDEHIHPAPKELVEFVKHAKEHKRKISDIRMELINKGWEPSIIEHAIQAAQHKH